MAKGELITIGAAATAIGGAYKLGEFMFKAKKVRDVGPANAVYVRIIGRVRSDLDEVRRLLSVREVHDALESNPEKSRWVYGCMRDVRGALENITPHTERVAGDVAEGRRIGIRHRLYWLLSEQEKLANREKELVVAHSSLNEVLGYLTGLEPVEETKRPQSSRKEAHVDIDIKREAPQHTTERIDREVYIERDAAPRRVEEPEVYIDRQGPPRYEEHRDIHFDGHARGAHVEGDIHVDSRGPHTHVERDIHIERQRDPRYEQQDPRYEAQYDPRYEQDQYHSQYPEERRFPEPLGRRPEAYEDRLPERDSWMQSSSRQARANGTYPPYNDYAEYGAPQPVGAAHYARRFTGDAGFGDENVLKPHPSVPLPKEFRDREVSERARHGFVRSKF